MVMSIFKGVVEVTGCSSFDPIVILPIFIKCFLSSPLSGKRDIVVTIFVRCMCVLPCVRPDHILYNNAWISKLFGTVVALEEEKYHLKHFYVG